MKEALLVRFEKSQRSFIRKESKKRKDSEAAIVRMAVDNFNFALKEKELLPIKEGV